jgi:flagellar protein FlgJ
MNELKQSTKLSPKDFCTEFLPFAKDSEATTGIAALATLAQAALESGWNQSSPGWMFFGVKDTSGIDANRQLLTTTEYSPRNNDVYPVVISIETCVRNGKNMFKYRVKDWFRKYATPADCFTDHAQFFFKNPRYAAALAVKSDPFKFIQEIAKAGYATDPNYADTLTTIAKMIQKYIV